jgi:hypothetical protein
MTKQIIALITIIGASFGTYFYLEAKFASNIELIALKSYASEIGQRLDLKILEDKIFYTKQRLYKILDRYGIDPQDPFVRQEKRELQDILKMLEQQREKFYQ